MEGTSNLHENRKLLEMSTFCDGCCQIFGIRDQHSEAAQYDIGTERHRKDIGIKNK